MAEKELKDSKGRVLYYWSVVENGIHFSFEVYGVKGTAFSGDSEIIFTMPHSEYHKVYQKYGIDPNVPMDIAIEQISESGRGAELAKDLSGEIERVDQFHWISFDD
jgi:hypothetical protein